MHDSLKREAGVLAEWWRNMNSRTSVESAATVTVSAIERDWLEAYERRCNFLLPSQAPAVPQESGQPISGADTIFRTIRRALPGIS